MTEVLLPFILIVVFGIGCGVLDLLNKILAELRKRRSGE